MLKPNIAHAILAGVYASAVLTQAIQPAYAGEITSAYSKLDFENGCVWDKPTSPEEEQMGGSALCDGLSGYPVHFAEDDLRQFVAYGLVDDPMMFPNGFSQWNSVHDTIEWRLEDGKPFATIHRWFLDNTDPQTGATDPSMRGQVLAISTVGDPDAPAGERVSCTVGYVDALANKDANTLARQIANDMAKTFLCGKDRPAFHGVRGNRSGNPNDIGE